MTVDKKGKPEQNDELRNLPPKKADQVIGGKHPAKVTVPDLK